MVLLVFFLLSFSFQCGFSITILPDSISVFQLYGAYVFFFFQHCCYFSVVLSLLPIFFYTSHPKRSLAALSRCYASCFLTELTSACFFFLLFIFNLFYCVHHSRGLNFILSIFFQ